MNRERIAGWTWVAIAAALASTPADAKDAPKPGLSLDPITARSLLAPIEEGRGALSAYRLDPGIEPSAGQRAKLSLEVGDSTLFAITGRLNRQPLAAGPLDPGLARTLGPRRDSGKVYGAGVSRTVRGVNLSATYQYSKITAGQPEPETELRGIGPGKSHSIRATARIRFRP